MKYDLIITLTAFPLLIIAVTGYLYEDTSSDASQIELPARQANLSADNFLRQSSITRFNDDGKPKSKLVSREMLHYPGKKDTELAEPVITLHRETGAPWIITAKQGQLSATGDKLFLKGDTVIDRKRTTVNNHSRLETPHLTIWPDKEYMQTNQPVKLWSANTTATGIGLKANLREGRYFLLHNVRGNHVPPKK